MALPKHRLSTSMAKWKGRTTYSGIGIRVEDDEAAAAAANDADTKWEREKVDAATSIDLAFEEAMRRIDASYKRCINRL